MRTTIGLPPYGVGLLQVRACALIPDGTAAPPSESLSSSLRVATLRAPLAVLAHPEDMPPDGRTLPPRP
jgi:hypothetical protein